MASAGVHSLSKSLQCAHKYQEVSVALGQQHVVSDVLAQTYKQIELGL